MSSGKWLLPQTAPKQWRQYLEQKLAKRIAQSKMKMLEVFERDKWCRSFDIMQIIIGGTRAVNYEAWKELKREGIITQARVGWSLAGRDRLTNTEIIHTMMEHSAFVSKQRELRAMKREADEAQAKATRMTDKLVRVARPFLEQIKSDLLPPPQRQLPPRPFMPPTQPPAGNEQKS